MSAVETNGYRRLTKVDQLRRDADALRREAAYCERIASLCSLLADAYDTAALTELPLVGNSTDPNPPAVSVSALVAIDQTATTGA